MPPVPPRALVVGAALLAGAVAWPRLPDVAAADAPAGLFSAARALVHIAEWAKTPRPNGSAAHAAVVAGAEAELTGLGFVVEREYVPGKRPLTNLVAHAPGQPTAGGVWLVAHTDSVPESPGAADDGLGLGVVVEAARALSHAGVPADLHVLLTDGEELGLLGAIAHVDAHPEATRRIVLNVEARGTEGPAYMFQLAGASPALLEVWRQAGCGAQATSLARTVYDQLPNDTDFSVFRRAGYWGYDFALIGGAHRYHSAEDTPANLDPRSVQQMGDCVVGLAQGWLGRPRESTDATRVYFQVPGGTVVSPPWVIQLLGAAAVLALPRPRFWSPVAGAAAWLGALIVAFLAGFGLLGVALATRADFWERDAEMVGAGGWYLAAGAVGSLVAFGAGRLAARPLRAWGWHAAVVVLAALAALAVPTAGYVLVPGAFVSVLLARGRPGLAVIPAVLAGLLVTPVLYAIYPALTTRMLPILAVVPVLMLAWMLGPTAAARSPGPAAPSVALPRRGPTSA
ncbi:MAG: M28 family peptidase [Myxococcota bacterium]